MSGARARAARQLPDLLTDVLRDVSRAFYLTMRVLPAGVREPVSVAYLLARAADTIADTAAVSPEARLRLLLAFREMVNHGPASAGLAALSDALAHGVGADSAGEGVLMRRVPDVFALHAGLPAPDRALVSQVVTTLTTGMERDLNTFPPEGGGTIGCLPDAAALDRYTWEVAGCVGDFWTRVTAAHTPALRAWDVERMSAVGQRFGQGLQLVNVLRDMPRDLANGRCYLPADELAAIGLAPADLTDLRNTEAARPIIARWTARARDHLAEAQRYVLAIPRTCVRLRLAALWPVVIGLETLRACEAADAWLDPARRVKVSRGVVYRMIAISLPASLSNAALTKWFQALGGGTGGTTSSRAAQASSRSRSESRNLL